MAYIIVVNPQILSQTGMPWGGVFQPTIIAAIIGTLVMGLFANVPYAQAAGMEPQRVLHLHRVLRPRLQLAADHVHGVPVRPDQHPHHPSPRSAR